MLAGEADAEEIVLNGIDWYRRNHIDLRLGVRIDCVDRANHVVHGNDSSCVSYDNLIFATGAKPLIPAIEGTNKEGVYVFRTLDDTRTLIEKSTPGLKTSVIGGVVSHKPFLFGLAGATCHRSLRGYKLTPPVTFARVNQSY